MNDAQIKHMVERFLGWKLPENFNPDCGISFQRTHSEHSPVGTNLFDYTQAEAMVRYMLQDLPRVVLQSEWQPIETAPRDGTVIEITAFEDSGETFEIHPMQWAHIQRNELFAPGQVGMWTAPNGAYTWRDGEFGPTHWRPATKAYAANASSAQQKEI